MAAPFLSESPTAMEGVLGPKRNDRASNTAPTLEEELEAARRRVRFLEALADGLPVALFAKDSAGRYVFCNETYARYLGRTKDEVVGGTPWQVHRPDMAAEIAWQDMAMFEQQGASVFPMDLPPGFDGVKRILIHKGVFTPGEGESLLIAGAICDISSCAEAEAAMREQAEGCEAAMRARSAFLADMSHEIRTPVSTIVGAIDLLLEAKVSEEAAELLSGMRIAANSLLRLIGDILDLSRIEAGKIALEWELFSPRTVGEEVLRSFEIMARKKELTLRFSPSSSLPARVIGDEGRLRQVLVNLIGNALKFTSKGSVTLTAEAFMAEEGPVRLLFRVIDTGAGIPEDRLSKIFDLFSYADGARLKRAQGAGLGLAISKRLVEAMGGSIAVESAEGKGSIFSFSVQCGRAPLGDVDAVDAAESALTLPTELRVLLAEDNPMNSRLARILLERKGWHVDVAMNGVEAVEAVAGTAYDLVLMDVQMPEMDGLEATRRIRASGASMPVVAMTAYAMKEDERECREAGMDGFVSKPVKAEVLFAAIARVLCAAASGGSCPSVEERAPSVVVTAARREERFGRLLRIVDDDLDMFREVLDDVLRLMPPLVEALEAAMASRDPAQIEHAAHKMKGSIAYFDVDLLVMHLQRMETAGKQGDAAGAVAERDTVRREIAAFLDEVRAFRDAGRGGDDDAG